MEFHEIESVTTKLIDIYIKKEYESISDYEKKEK